MTDVDKRFWNRDLFKLLKAKITSCNGRCGGLSIHLFAKKMGSSPEGLYKYLRADHLTLEGAKKIIAAADGAITPEMLIPFLFD